MTDGDDGRRYGPILAALAGVIAALLVVLVVVLIAGDDDSGDTQAATTATGAPSSTAGSTEPLPPTTTTTLPASTTTSTAPLPTTTTVAATTTTVAPTTTTTTTTTPPFSGTLDDKHCTASGAPADMVTDIRFAQREGFTRVVFDFSGGVPGCFTTYNDPHTIYVIAWFVDTGNAYAGGIFDGGGQLQINTNSVNRVSAGGPSAGSGEWEFAIDLGVPNRPYHVFTLEGPSRLVVDISD